MSRIIVSERRGWTRQPQQPVKVSARGLFKDVVFAAVAGQPESISGVLPVPIGSSSIAALRQGRGLYSPSTTVGGWSWPVSPSHPIYSITTQHTIIVFGRLDSIALYGNVFGVPHASTWSAPYYAMGISGNSPETTLAAAASVTASMNVASIASGLVTGQETSFAVTRNGTSGAYYRGGSLFGSLTWADGGAINFVNKRPPVLFNRSSSANGEGVQGSAAAVLVFKRALSADEIARVVENPWQIFARRDRYAFITVSAGGLSISASVGQADASAFQANVNLQRTIAASIATAAASGFAATVNLQRNIAATRGDASAFGNLANVDLRRAIAAALGSAAASGYDASISIAGALNIPASLGVAEATGKQALVNLVYSLNASTGIASAIGFDAALSNEEAPFTQAQLDYLLAYMQENLMIPTVEEIAAAVLSALNATTIPVNIKAVNDKTITGSGVTGDSMRPV